MFYCHEILTSQRHGVATVWLVATLGQNSSSKKINRKAILGVDVPRACETIMHPEAPIALRLQGNLLYGISKVYSRQCLYTLTDVQAMLDKMKIALNVVHGRGLKLNAGEAKPEDLVVPYDPAFIPDFTIPSLDLDLFNPFGSTVPDPQLNSSLLWSNFSGSPHSQLDIAALPKLDAESLNPALAEIGELSFGSGYIPSARNNIFDDRDIKVEEGFLIRPDFDFDEEGNIIDLAMIDATALQVEMPLRERLSRKESQEFVDGPQVMDTPVKSMFHDDLQRNEDPDAQERPSPSWGRLPDPDYIDESDQKRNAASNQKPKTRKGAQLDVATQIGREELLQWNHEYLQNMARFNLQKAYARRLTQAKKNAISWVSDNGIGSVGMGIGISGASHPLKLFCGEALLDAFSDGQQIACKKRKRSASSVEFEEPGDRNVRRKITEGEVKVSLTRERWLDSEQEVELGLDAPPPLPDDVSLQMPWNITASLQGSVAGSSAVSHQFHGAMGKAGSRFPSASPLAGRGLPPELFGNDSLSSLSFKDFGDFHDDDAGGFDREGDCNKQAARTKFESQLTVSTLNDTDRNFLDFLKARTYSAKQRIGLSCSPITIAFSELLPPKSTSRAVSTQALMHVLALATKDVIQVWQGKRFQEPAYVIDDLDEIRLKIKDGHNDVVAF